VNGGSPVASVRAGFSARWSATDSRPSRADEDFIGRRRACGSGRTTLRRGWVTQLVTHLPGRAKRAGAKRGARAGCKLKDCHELVDRWRTSLAVQLSSANCYDSIVFEALLDAVMPVRPARGRPRK